MQTFTQTFAGSQTWTINVPGKYFTVLGCTNPITTRFYIGGRRLDLGEISQLLAGLEVTLGEIDDKNAAFDRVEIDVTGPDTIQVGIGNGQARYNRSAGSVQIIGTVPVSLSVVDLNTLTRPRLPTGQWTNNATVAANTPLTIFNAAANVNGAILWNAGSTDVIAGAIMQTFLAKATAPANVADGQVCAMPHLLSASGANYTNISLPQPVRIDPGLGLYFISSAAGAAGMLRFARYELL